MKWVVKRGWVLLLFLFVLLCVLPARAGNYCARVRSVYHAPYYVAPAVHHSYGHHATLLKAVPAYVSPDYYSSVSDYYRDKLLVDAVAGKLASLQARQEEIQKLRTELEILRARLGVQPPPSQPSQPPPAPRPEVLPQQAPRAPKGDGRVGGGGPVSQKLQASFDKHCARCHGPTYEAAGGGFDFQDLASVPTSMRLLMYADVNSGHMPKNGKPIPDDEVLEFYSYATGRQVAQAPKK